MKKILIPVLALFACGSVFAAGQNVVRMPAMGIKAATTGSGNTAPGGVVPPVVAPPVFKGPRLEVVSSYDMGAVLLGESKEGSISVKNSGTEPLTINYVERPSDAFSVYAQEDSCRDGGVLAPSETCSYIVYFYPWSEGPISEWLLIDTDGGMGAVELKGFSQGQPQALDVLHAPSGVLKVVPEGTTTGLGSYQFSFKNNGNIALTTKSVSTRALSTGGSSATVSENTCTAPVQPGATCSFTLSPTTAQSAEVTLAFAETSKVTKVSYTINAESPQLSPVDSRVVGNILYRTYKNPNTVVPVSIKGVSLVDPTTYADISTSFNVTGCVNTTLAPGASCELAVEYLPSRGIRAAVYGGIYYVTSVTGSSTTLGTWGNVKWW